MAQYFAIHPEDPQPRLLRQAAAILRTGGVIVYPTDSCYALGCQIGNREAVERMREIRGLGERHYFTLLCRELAEVARYARVDNRQFRLLRAALPGSYTFILEATREAPRRLQHEKRKTIGVRVPQHAVAQGLLAELGEPLVTTTLLLPGEDHPLNDPEEIRARLGRRVELVIDCGSCGLEPTTVVDLSGAAPLLLRQGRGSLAALGLEA